MTTTHDGLRAKLERAGVMRPARTISDLRRMARRRLPLPVFDFIDGGAEDEVTLRRNTDDFKSLALRPRALVDVSTRRLATTVLGTSISSPVLFAPCGLARLAHRDGELAAARAAAAAETIFTLSTSSSYSIEEVGAASAGPQWFQLYVWQDRDVTLRLVQRAQEAGYQALCFTVDVPLSGQRERDLRNGMTIPPKPGPLSSMHYARHPLWLYHALLGEPITFRNFLGQASGNSAVSLGTYVNSMLNPSMCWDDLRWLRGVWDGPLVVKGLMRVEDARSAVQLGADALVVSNHGGRQLDGLPSTISVLGEIVDAVGDRAEVLLDGGVRRGSDVAKALALGARACMVGRPWLFGLAAAGELGAARSVEILTSELDRTLALLGVRDVADLDRSHVRTQL